MFVVALQVLFKTMSCTSLLLDELNSSTCNKKEEKYLIKITFSEKWKAILIKKISYSEKADLENEISVFLNNKMMVLFNAWYLDIIIFMGITHIGWYF